jgi:hypothetical protein
VAARPSFVLGSLVTRVTRFLRPRESASTLRSANDTQPGEFRA